MVSAGTIVLEFEPGLPHHISGDVVQKLGGVLCRLPLFEFGLGHRHYADPSCHRNTSCLPAAKWTPLTDQGISRSAFSPASVAARETCYRARFVSVYFLL